MSGTTYQLLTRVFPSSTYFDGREYLGNPQEIVGEYLHMISSRQNGRVPIDGESEVKYRPLEISHHLCASAGRVIPPKSLQGHMKPTTS